MGTVSQTKLEFGSKSDKRGLSQRVIFPCGYLKKPYRDSFGNVEKGDHTSIAAKKIASRLSQCVVAVKSYCEGATLFACSGTIIKWDGQVATVLTLATLFRPEDEDADFEPQNVTVKVRLPNREKVLGCVTYLDHHHNIATLTIRPTSSIQVPTVELSSETFVTWRSVVALGRHLTTYDLLACSGETGLQYIDLDSDDLLSSTCVISKYGIGGPLVDMVTGDIIGINFRPIDKGCTAFLLSSIVRRCLDHVNTYGEVKRPWLGLKTRCFDTFDISKMEAIHMKFPGIEGVFVEKVMKGSPADSAGVCPGDVISQCDGISVQSPLEIQNILFEKAETASGTSSCPEKKRKISLENENNSLKVVVHKGSCGSIEVKSISLDTFTPAIINRWPLKKKRDARDIVDCKRRYAVGGYGIVW